MTEKKNYVKDPVTNLVTNKDYTEYEVYKKKRDKILKQEALEEKINTLENQMGEMYEMLKKIASKV